MLNTDPSPSSACVNSSIKPQLILKLRSYLSRVYSHCAHKDPGTCRSDISDAEGWGVSHLPCSLDWCRAVLGFRMSHTAGKAHRQRVIRVLSRSLSCAASLHALRERESYSSNAHGQLALLYGGASSEISINLITRLENKQKDNNLIFFRCSFHHDTWPKALAFTRSLILANSKAWCFWWWKVFRGNPHPHPASIPPSDIHSSVPAPPSPL